MSLTRLRLAPQCRVDVDNENDKQPPGDVTRLLQRWSDGDATALDSLWPLVYDDIRRMAGRQVAGERRGHTLQATALVNEAFLRLAGQRAFEWQRREQFLSLVAQIMRHVLVDYARQRSAQRRGAWAKKVSLDNTWAADEAERVQALDAFHDESVDVLAIDEALTRLQKVDEPQSRIVELRYFGGLTLEETASVAGISLASVKREWAMARAWLRRELEAQNVGAAR
jgi:RNA polymerase sigma factor (TIGR02999 family)